MNKKEIERKARNINIPPEDKILDALNKLKEKNPRALKKLKKKLQKAFPDKDFSHLE